MKRFLPASCRDKVFLPLLLLLLFAPPVLPSAGAQVPELVMDHEFRPDARAAIDSIYNFRFDAAREVLRPWRNRHPQHPLWELIDGIELWWQVLADLHDRSRDEELMERMARVDYAASRLLDRQAGHADALIIKAISNGYIARQRSNRGNWISSLNVARKALSAYDLLQQQNTGLADLKLAEGLMIYYSSWVPDTYPVVRPVAWFLPDGDKQKGLELLRQAADSAVFASAEATYFLGNITYHHQRDYREAAHHFESLYRDYPRNSYYVRTYVRALFESERYEEAQSVIRASLERWEARSLSFGRVLREELLGYRGRIHMERGNHDLAEEALRASFRLGEELPGTDERPSHVISGYYLGRVLHELDRNEEALEVLEHVRRHDAESGYRDRAGALIRRIGS
ncbi:MAG: tetratricopeptide repeat protein [Balneolaceae bacterium]|nr:tetratricopeptide repeat protein [Balneolaceae bacterium]